MPHFLRSAICSEALSLCMAFVQWVYGESTNKVLVYKWRNLWSYIASAGPEGICRE